MREKIKSLKRKIATGQCTCNENKRRRLESEESDNDIDGYLAKQAELKASKKPKKIHTIEDSK